MMSPEALSILENAPELLLALSLSAPSATGRSPSDRQFTFEFTKEELIVRSPLTQVARAQETHLLCTKKSIATALLLHHVWRQRVRSDDEPTPMSSDFEQHLTEAVLVHARVLGERSTRRRSLLRQDDLFLDETMPLFARLDIPQSLVSEVDSRCHVIFSLLERKGWAINPGFTVFPELMVLFGLVPMQWSVRTPEGERVYREIRINAPLWSLNIDRIRDGKKKWTDWQFNFRGISFIRGILQRFAEQYLASEEQARRLEGQPTLPAPNAVSLDKE